MNLNASGNKRENIRDFVTQDPPRANKNKSFAESQNSLLTIGEEDAATSFRDRLAQCGTKIQEAK